MAPAHTPLSPSPQPISLPVLPVELQDLLDSVARRLIDLENYQIPQLSSCKGPINLHEQIAGGIRVEIVGIKRDLEELKLLVDDLDRAKDKRAGEAEIIGINSRLNSITKSYREAVLISKRSIDNNAHLSARDELFLNASKSGGTIRGVTEIAVSPDDALMNATSDVTEGLRRTMQLMQQELDRSLISNEILESSTATMQMTSDQYSTFSTLLSTSKALITSLERADFLDRLIILFALIFFVLSCAYVFKRRVVDKGIRVAGALSRVVAGSNSKSSPRAVDMGEWDSGEDYGVVGDVLGTVITGTATLAAVVEAVTQRRRGRMREIKSPEVETIAEVKPVAIVEPVAVEPILVAEVEIVASLVEAAPVVPVVEVVEIELPPVVVEAPIIIEEVKIVESILEVQAPKAVVIKSTVEEVITPVETPKIIETPAVVVEAIPETIVEIPVVEKIISPVAVPIAPIAESLQSVVIASVAQPSISHPKVVEPTVVEPVVVESVVESVVRSVTVESLTVESVVDTIQTISTDSIAAIPTDQVILAQQETTLEVELPLVKIQLLDVPLLLQKPLEHPLDSVPVPVENQVVDKVEEVVVVPIIKEEVAVPVLSETSQPVLSEVVLPIESVAREPVASVASISSDSVSPVSIPITLPIVSIIKEELVVSSIILSETSLSSRIPSPSPSPVVSLVAYDVEAMISLLKSGATPSSIPQGESIPIPRVELPSPDNLFPGYGSQESVIQVIPEVVIPAVVVIPSITPIVPILESTISSIPAETPLPSVSVSVLVSTDPPQSTNTQANSNAYYESVIAERVAAESLAATLRSVLPPVDVQPSAIVIESPLAPSSILTESATAVVTSIPSSLLPPSVEIPQVDNSDPIIDIFSPLLEIPSAAPATPPVPVVDPTPIISVVLSAAPSVISITPPPPSVVEVNLASAQESFISPVAQDVTASVSPTILDAYTHPSEAPVLSSTSTSTTVSIESEIIPVISDSLHAVTTSVIDMPSNDAPLPTVSVVSILPNQPSYSSTEAVVPLSIVPEILPVDFIPSPVAITPELTPSNVHAADSLTTPELSRIEFSVPIDLVPTDSEIISASVTSANLLATPFSHLGIAPLEVDEVNEIPVVLSPSPESLLPSPPIDFIVSSPSFIADIATPTPLDTQPLPLILRPGIPTLSLKELNFPPSSDLESSSPPVAEPAKSEPVPSVEPTPEAVISSPTFISEIVTPLPHILVTSSNQDEFTLPLVDLDPTESTVIPSTSLPYIIDSITFNQELPSPTQIEVEIPVVVGEASNGEIKTAVEVVVLGSNDLHEIHTGGGESELPHGAEIVDVQVEYYEMINGVKTKVDLTEIDGDTVIFEEVYEVPAEEGKEEKEVVVEEVEVSSLPVVVEASVSISPFPIVEASQPVVLADATALPVESIAPIVGRSVVDFATPEVIPVVEAEIEVKPVVATEVEFNVLDWMKDAQADMLAESQAGAVVIPEPEVVISQVEVNVGEAVEKVVGVEGVEDLEGEDWDLVLQERRREQAMQGESLLKIVPLGVRDEL